MRSANTASPANKLQSGRPVGGDPLRSVPAPATTWLAWTGTERAARSGELWWRSPTTAETENAAHWPRSRSRSVGRLRHLIPRVARRRQPYDLSSSERQSDFLLFTALPSATFGVSVRVPARGPQTRPCPCGRIPFTPTHPFLRARPLEGYCSLNGRLEGLASHPPAQDGTRFMQNPEQL